MPFDLTFFLVIVLTIVTIIVLSHRLNHRRHHRIVASSSPSSYCRIVVIVAYTVCMRIAIICAFFLRTWVVFGNSVWRRSVCVLIADVGGFWEKLMDAGVWVFYDSMTDVCVTCLEFSHLPMRMPLIT